MPPPAPEGYPAGPPQAGYPDVPPAQAPQPPHAGAPPPQGPGGAAQGYPPPPGFPPPPEGFPPGGLGLDPRYQAYPGARRGKQNTLAITALVLSLVGFIVVFTAPVGTVLGHVARRQIRDTGEDGEGMALAAIIIGWVITGLVLLGCVAFVILAAVAGNNHSTAFG